MVKSRHKRYKLITAFFLLILAYNDTSAQTVTELFQPVADSIQVYLEQFAFGGDLKVSKVSTRNGLQITFNNALSAYPFREEQVDSVKAIIKRNMPSKYSLYKANFRVLSNGYTLEELKSNIISNDNTFQYSVDSCRRVEPSIPLVTNLSKVSKPTNGLQNRHIAVWPSHGYYYSNQEMRWKWQRARYFETIEDLYTLSYVYPFLTPMLENAGANVLMARERDTNNNEVVVDNDRRGSGYSEKGSWTTSKKGGFGYKREYIQGENPFEMGSARIARGSDSHSAAWIPDIPEGGEYGVYISYQSFENSCENVKYIVRHTGGESVFSINQKMGGGTWVYLGKFAFEKGKNDSHGVFLEVEDGYNKGVISADAVRFGGGMGNIARSPLDSIELIKPEISGKPRFAEAARYYLQYSGMVDSLYSAKEDDYSDDVASRGLWVNALTGGSSVNPLNDGLKIPVDLAFALHSDAGSYMNDSIIGTMAIYTLKNSDGKRKFPNGVDRSTTRDYADAVQTQIVNDIRALYCRDWSRRQLLDRNYAETRNPDVPAIMIELLSHQNFSDMRYGNDPSFKFHVSRAIYKGILKYLAYVNNFDYVVQPLPVQGFRCEMDTTAGGLNAHLSWAPTIDPLEPTATPDAYILYQRRDGAGWDNGIYVEGTEVTVPVQKGHLSSYKITAINKGGESFPSEILSMGIVDKNAKTVLIINNFDRVAAASDFATADTTMAGFRDDIDRGVALYCDNSYVGAQTEFRRDRPWVNDDNSGFGDSRNDFETKTIAGNSFDYPAVHGAAMMASGYNFCSIGNEAISDVDWSQYDVVDIICGKQITTKVGHDDSFELKYRVFDDIMQEAVKKYASNGGNIIVSGANIAFDIWDQEYQYKRDSLFEATVTKPSKSFVNNVLKFDIVGHFAVTDGAVKSVKSDLNFPVGINASFITEYNPYRYANETVDGIAPVGKNARTIFRYNGNGVSAGVAYIGDDYRAVSLGFPLESIVDQKDLYRVMSAVLNLFRY